MNTATAPGLPASRSIAPSGRLRRSAALGVEFSTAALYVAWAAVVMLADAVDAAPLATGSGRVLGLGCALTTALFYGLSRLPVADRPARETLVTAQSMAGLVWATLYTWFTGPEMAGPLLAVGMYLSAIAPALIAVNVRMLGRMMLAALLASAVNPVLRWAAIGRRLVAGRRGACHAGPLPLTRHAARGCVLASPFPGWRASTPANPQCSNCKPVSNA